MVDIMNITGREIGLNLDAEKKTLILQVVGYEDDDSQNVELQNSAGFDIQPPDDADTYVLDVAENYRLAIATNDNIEPDESINPGEIEFYSSESGERKSKIRLKINEIVLNDGEDYATKYNELETAFNQLQADHDKLADTVKLFFAEYNANVIIFNAHVHVPGVKTVTPEVPTTQTTEPSSADITPAKSETVRIP